jgi:hypothetical protein
MRTTLIILLSCINLIGLSQPFTYSGWVKGANEQGLANIPVTLWGLRTDPYEVTFPTYSTASSYTTGTIIPSSDDATHGPFNIGFTFNFFGNNYTQFYVGSNGWIGFSPGQTTGYTAAYIPNASSPMNSILADWEDLLPVVQIFTTRLSELHLIKNWLFRLTMYHIMDVIRIYTLFSLC